MDIQGYRVFWQLMKQGHDPGEMGFKGTIGEISRWSSRFKLARNLQGLSVAECSDRTLMGYHAFFKVFLTHSAMERYLPIVGLIDSTLKDALMPYNPREVVHQFFELDRSGKLFDFLHSRVNPRLKGALTACREGVTHDIFCLSAAIRHIFAHGHLAANSNDIDPKRVSRACEGVANFLLDFMECDFSRRISEYHQSSVGNQ